MQRSVQPFRRARAVFTGWLWSVALVLGVPHAFAQPADMTDPASRIAAHAAASPTPVTPPTGDAMPLGRASSSRVSSGRALDSAERAVTTDGGTGGYLLSTAGALGLVIGLVLATRWVIVKLGGRPVARGNSAVELLSRTAVAPKSHVLLLRVGARVLVVGDAAGVLRPLGEINEPQEVADLLGAVTASRPGSVTQSFGGLLDRFNRDHDEADSPPPQADATIDALSGLKSRLKNMGGA